MEKMETNDLALVAITMRYLWLKRNQVVFCNKFKVAHLVLETARYKLSGYLSTYDIGSKNTKVTTRVLIYWSPLDSGSVKLNWDTFVSAMTKQM